MSYEARNCLDSGVRNLIVTLDYNNFGIDDRSPRCCRPRT